mmetsp:Transcript_10813/g.30976  ORF Transcript_10813/g.30976 Transcript_10813/m.30976 type:complete len:84 (+) Transcript_10813:1936-2187(+)
MDQCEGREQRMGATSRRNNGTSQQREGGERGVGRRLLNGASVASGPTQSDPDIRMESESDGRSTMVSLSTNSMLKKMIEKRRW